MAAPAKVVGASVNDNGSLDAHQLMLLSVISRKSVQNVHNKIKEKERKDIPLEHSRVQSA